MKSLLAAALVCACLGGCAVVAVGSAAVGVAGVAVDAAVGAVKLTGKAVGAAVDVVTPGSDPKN
jgi:hypothetical protein